MYYRKILGLEGVFAAVTAKFKSGDALFRVDRDDTAHPFYLRIGTTDIPTYDQVFYEEEYNFIAAEHPKTIIDAGANIGLTSIYLANRYPEAKIIAIEPELGNFELLVSNTKHYLNITPLNVALWYANGILQLTDPGGGSWGFRTSEDASSHDVICDVESFTVDRIMGDYGIEVLDILKVDIEGAEKEVFENSEAWINKVNVVIVELHERFKSGCNRSFYKNTEGFDDEWSQGELVYLARGGVVKNAGIR